MRVDLRGVRLFDPAEGLDRVADLLVEDGVIAAIGHGLPRGDETVEAEGALVTPGLCDVHVHLREPGQTQKEDIDSGLRAALAGGFTDVCAMPNTKPPIDEAWLLRQVLGRAAGHPVRMHQIAAMTKGQAGTELTEFGALLGAGAVAFSDDGHGVARSTVMRLALQYAQAFGALIVSHAEDPDLAGSGVMHEGKVSYRLGLPGQPRSAESSIVARDLELLRDVGGRLHVAHVSTRETLSLLRRGREDGLAVSGEVTPHHLLLTDEAVAELGSLAKMNPPLREASDREALREALRDGLIDCIATDHAPHTAQEKSQGMLGAPNGVIGLETAFSSLYSGLVQEGQLPLERLVTAMTAGPRAVFGLRPVALREGREARLSVFDLSVGWTVGPGTLRSRSGNSALLGRTLQGRALGIITEGRWHPVAD
jgi:dihydroorotase